MKSRSIFTKFALIGLAIFALVISVGLYASGDPVKGTALQALTMYAVVSDNGEKRVINNKEHPHEFKQHGLAGVFEYAVDEQAFKDSQCSTAFNPERQPDGSVRRPIPDIERVIHLITTNGAEAANFKVIIPASSVDRTTTTSTSTKTTRKRG